MEIKTNKRAIFISIIFALAFSLAMCIGYAIQSTGELMVRDGLWWTSILGVWIIGGVAFYFILTRIRLIKETEANETNASLNIKYFLLAWTIILLCWIPVFLAEYPGFFVYDATDEYVEVATRTFSTHHPLIHVLMLGGAVCAGNKLFGAYNVGIAMYTLFQMALVSIIFACIAYRARTKLGFCLSVAWYGIFPTVVMFALCSAKDTLFGAFVLAACMLSTDLIRKLKTGVDYRDFIKTNKIDISLLFISLCFMMLFRNNGMYGFLVYLATVVIYMLCADIKHSESGIKKFKRTIVVLTYMICVLGAYKLADRGLVLATHASDIESQEMLTVPIQQLARTWHVYRGEMTTEELQNLYEVLPETALAHYTPSLSDPVKAQFNNEAYSKWPGKYIRLWFSLLREHPLGYINAWLNTSYGFYYPGTVVNVYEGHEVNTFTYTDSSYFGYEVEYPGERHSVIPIIDKFYRWLSLDDDIQRIPVISLVFSMASYFWLYVAIACVLIYRRCGRELLVALSLPMGIWLTLLLGPTFLPRYTVFLWFMLPWILQEFKKSLSGD